MPVSSMRSAKLLNLNGSFKRNLEMVKNKGFFFFFCTWLKGLLFSQNFEVVSMLDLRRTWHTIIFTKDDHHRIEKNNNKYRSRVFFLFSVLCTLKNSSNDARILSWPYLDWEIAIPRESKTKRFPVYFQLDKCSGVDSGQVDGADCSRAASKMRSWGGEVTGEVTDLTCRLRDLVFD